ncbi:hypothetical protein ALNOE001_07020 [Candidatus Methanobinarius endosymbioticus]|uniref:NYN domain-containing protein n=1 Tax=Candidatus Methanobinarius endosymbioticus TaxID=2006182 RepID=A0A366MDI6_9EURY|nr:hypothetical protein ALNOE001_07020 [Candidatus Methanobinarius endosymbioticus]
MRKFEKLSSLNRYIPLMKKDDEINIGLLVDGPNILIKEFNLDLNVVKNLMGESGDLRIVKVLFNQYASDKLIESVVNQGFTPLVVAGDTDVHMAIEAMKLIYNPNIDIIALMTRGADFLPIMNKSKENGKETIVIGVDSGFSIALKNSSDFCVVLSTDGKVLEK